jgi:hypothetical protein
MSSPKKYKYIGNFPKPFLDDLIAGNVLRGFRLRPERGRISVNLIQD